MVMRIFGLHEELSEDAQNTLLLYLGVMLGVNMEPLLCYVLVV